MAMNVEEEVGKLREEITRLGQPQPDGSIKCRLLSVSFATAGGMGSRHGSVVKFGVLFNDDRCANIFEALVGTLRAAKKRKVVSYDGELLLQGVHDNVEITLFAIPHPAAASS